MISKSYKKIKSKEAPNLKMTFVGSTTCVFTQLAHTTPVIPLSQLRSYHRYQFGAVWIDYNYVRTYILFGYLLIKRIL